TLGDIGVGIMAWVNVIAIILLSPKAFSALKEYENR
ncbi:MAG: alanine:cation symporter family protein, partial [Bacteroidales bacterium]|nr:alanine:cation symporter family protein [Bacteroidales bacterium]